MAINIITLIFHIGLSDQLTALGCPPPQSPLWGYESVQSLNKIMVGLPHEVGTLPYLGVLGICNDEDFSSSHPAIELTHCINAYMVRS
ncbi:hypothetical protein GDO86_016528 [Hymenochirus boettgeri]|uniref:Uncharacterized protein n=1 Tax=Hymenochirus boettgeri TaxID=247094 RepID=A0A8T2K2B0_9PIPI|nr:hypothetical protein GDO86_016528 [Hymenochirus boettgeri]